jgi:hypothetical protein
MNKPDFRGAPGKDLGVDIEVDMGIDRSRGSAKPSNRLPTFLRPFFWDTDFAGLRWDRDRDFIMVRLLSAGTWRALSWLRRYAGDGAIKTWIQTHCGAGLSPQQLAYWAAVLDLPARRIDAWLADPHRRIWDERVRR